MYPGRSVKEQGVVLPFSEEKGRGKGERGWEGGTETRAGRGPQSGCKVNLKMKKYSKV